MDKLTIEHLKNYLGTNLEMYYTGFGANTKGKSIVKDWTISITDSWDIYFRDEYGNIDDDVLFYFKPIMHRLSDLDKFIPEFGFVPLENLTSFQKGSGLNNLSSFKTVNSDLDEVYNDVQKLFEWHFWIFDQSYFDKGLIIDKLTYK